MSSIVEIAMNEKQMRALAVQWIRAAESQSIVEYRTAIHDTTEAMLRHAFKTLLAAPTRCLECDTAIARFMPETLEQGKVFIRE